ncbi:cyclin-dependent kinase inhibitor dacapo isoform X1 [Tachypleus tridentatus]|uniref:cyclin-dependent kinase inhibitor dacapo isoform X1 n=1 Tax=Tachypleus tridentatus TaxID=6853 RepID=UPI003FCF0393
MLEMIMGDTNLMIREIMSGNFDKAVGVCSSPQHLKARRALFGPIDHEENLKFVREEFSNIQDNDKERWNFDFNTETPMLGRYVWTRIEDTREVHPSYELKWLKNCDKSEEVNYVTKTLTVDSDTAKIKTAVTCSSSPAVSNKSGSTTLKQKKITEALRNRKRHSETPVSTGKTPETKTQRAVENSTDCAMKETPSVTNVSRSST